MMQVAIRGVAVCVLPACVVAGLTYMRVLRVELSFLLCCPSGCQCIGARVSVGKYVRGWVAWRGCGSLRNDGHVDAR